MLSYVNKLHMLIVNLGRKGRESLNKVKFYFVHCTKNHNFILLAMYNLKHFRFLLGSPQSWLGCTFKQLKLLPLLLPDWKSEQDRLPHRPLAQCPATP